MVVVAQLVERWLVEPDVAGSSPVGHPNRVKGPALRGAFPVGEAGSMPEVLERPEIVESTVLDSPWITIVWNDPVNLMTYVSWVFRSYFGFSKAEAERRMLQVHTDGRAVVATGSREEMERHVEAMHDFGLWATLGKADE
jgi:ATP-dependent Clp protease adaptor protein ClpS